MTRVMYEDSVNVDLTAGPNWPF